MFSRKFRKGWDSMGNEKFKLSSLEKKFFYLEKEQLKNWNLIKNSTSCEETNFYLDNKKENENQTLTQMIENIKKKNGIAKKKKKKIKKKKKNLKTNFKRRKKSKKLKDKKNYTQTKLKFNK